LRGVEHARVKGRKTVGSHGKKLVVSRPLLGCPVLHHKAAAVNGFRLVAACQSRSGTLGKGLNELQGDPMSLSPQDALAYIMVVTSAADTDMTSSELDRIGALVERLPVFEGYSREQLSDAAGRCIELTSQVDDLEKVIDAVLAALPERLHDTAYALAVEIAAVDLDLGQEELRWLEMLRDRLELDRLTTAAIEVAARARLRKL
jgi:hypothetical protein